MIHISTLENEVDAFCRSTVEDIASKPVDANWLACFLGVLVLGLQFYPPEHQGSPQINAIRSEGKCIVEWYRLATKCLAIESNFTITSLSGIQAAVLVLVHGREAPVFLRNLLKIAILSAQDMGLHQLGTADRAREASCEAVVRKEVGVRVW